MLLKVCCIQDEAELGMAVAAGATHVGLVAAMPSGPGPIADDRIADIVREVPAGVTAVLLTARTEATAIIEHARSTGVDAVQIVREVPAHIRLAVKAALPSVEILQVVHVEGTAALEEARRASVGSDHVLLDSGRRGATRLLTGRSRHGACARTANKRIVSGVFTEYAVLRSGQESSMKRRSIVAALVAAAAVTAAPVAAQSLTGTWELSQETQRGARTSTLALVQDGAELTGTLTLTLGGRRGGGGGGGPMEVEIEDGMVDGDSFSFTVTLSFGDNSIAQEYSGTFDGDAMEGEVAGGGRGGGGGARPFTGQRGG